ncbi:unnamed protein product, partial [Arabidopsis thaliana]
TNKSNEHVDNGEDPIDGRGRIEVREVIDGGDECVPWKKKANAEGEVDDVSEVVGIRRSFFGRSFVRIEEKRSLRSGFRVSYDSGGFIGGGHLNLFSFSQFWGFLGNSLTNGSH